MTASHPALRDAALALAGALALLGSGARAAELELYPTYENIGVYVTAPEVRVAPRVEYRRSGDRDARWLAGHSMTRLAEGRWASSILMVDEAAEYDVRVALGENVLASRVRTWQTPARPDDAALAAAVAVGPGNPGGVSAAIAAARPGSVILLADGDYYETIDVTRPVRLLAAGPNCRILGCREDLANPDGTDRWRPVGSGVYAVALEGTTGFVACNGKRLFHYRSLDEVRRLVHRYEGSDYELGGGWWQSDDRTLYVHLDPPADPDAVPMQVAVRNSAINVAGQANIVIDGIELGYLGAGPYGSGISIQDSTDVVVRNCRIHHVWTGIAVNGQAAERVTVEDCRFWDSSIHEWPWPCNKAHDTETSAISLNGRRGFVAWRNEISDFFNGIVASMWGRLEDEGWNADIDCCRNVFYRVSDDPMEPEGTCINNRYYLNTAGGCLQGISLCPITLGPVYVVRNLFYDFGGGGFKLSNGSSGDVYCYFNTVHTAAPERNGMGSSGPWDNMHWLNNIVMCTRYTVEDYTPKPRSTWDYNCHFTTYDGPLIKIENRRYRTLDELIAAKGHEKHGINADPRFVNAAAGDFRLRPDSPCIDSGVAIQGVYFEVTGRGPDMGCFEHGTQSGPPSLPAAR